MINQTQEDKTSRQAIYSSSLICRTKFVLTSLFTILLITSCVVMQNDAPETGAVYSEQRCYYDAFGVYHCSVCYGSECVYGRPAGNRFCYYTADSSVVCEIYQPQVQWHMHVYQDPFPPPPPPRYYYRRHRGRPDDYPEPSKPHRKR